MQAMLSMLGMYEYNNTLFDKFVVPEGINREDLINRMLIESAELNVIYSDFDTLKEILGIFSRSNLPRWTKLYETTTIEYDPIENYNKTEEWTDDVSASGEQSGTSKSDETVHSTSSANGNSQNLAVAFNSNTEKETGRNVSVSGTETNGTDNISGSNTSKSSGKSVNKHTGKIRGNIGVTTSQQMLTEQRKVLEFNIDSVIINETVRYVCMMIY